MEGSDRTCEDIQNTTEPAVRLSRVHTTELACLQELLKRLQDRHVQCAEAVAKKGAADAASAAAVSPDAPNVLHEGVVHGACQYTDS